MCKQNGLLIRGTSYFFQAKVPKDCQRQFGKQVVREKLPASSLAEAKALVRQKWVAFHQRVDQLRSGPSATPTDVDIQRYADAWLAYRLAEDEQRRIEGLDEREFEKLHEDLLLDTAVQKRNLARGGGDCEFMVNQMEWFLQSMYGVDIDPTTPAYRNAIYRFAVADLKATQLMQARHRGEIVETPQTAAPAVPPKATHQGTIATPAAPLLSTVITYFLDSYLDKSRPMYRKHRSVLPVFLDCLGDRPVDQYKQMDIEDFAKVISRLPPRAAPMARQKKISIKALSELTHPTTIAPKTFEDTFMASVRPFLAASRRIYGDSGFPMNLTTEGVVYRGTVKAGGNKQRPMTMEELQRLADALRPFATDATEVHKLWLPMVALHTGARINEICQINPQVDMGTEDDIPYFHITEETEGDERIRKSVKNASSRRRVPIHPDLISGGFMKYVEAIKATGTKLLFPQWTPSKRQASPNAEDWYGDFLSECGLRDDTPGRRVVGFHAFRSTFINRAKVLGVKDTHNLTGHKGDDSAVVRQYQDELPLPQKLAILRQVTFDLVWPQCSAMNAKLTG